MRDAAIERRRSSLDRVQDRRDELMREYGIDEDDFKLACRLADDPAFRERLAAIASHPCLEQIRSEWAAIHDEEYEPVEVSCQDCGGPGATYRRRPIGTYCDPCVRDAASRPSTPPLGGIRSALTRARRAGLPATLTESEWREAVEYFADRCGLCGGPWSIVEHATSVSLGGGTTASNCYPACVPCNAAKRSTEIEHIAGENAQNVLRWLRSRGRK